MTLSTWNLAFKLGSDVSEKYFPTQKFSMKKVKYNIIMFYIDVKIILFEIYWGKLKVYLKLILLASFIF